MTSSESAKVLDATEKLSRNRAADYARLLEKRVGPSDTDTTPAENGQSDLPLKDFSATWLSWQCRMVSGVIHGTLFLPNALFLPDVEEEAIKPFAQWPETGTDSSLLSEIASLVLTQKRSIIRSNQQYGEGQGHVCDLVACPLFMDGELVSVVTVMMSPRSQPQRHAVQQLLEWGIMWLETLLRQHSIVRKERSDMMVQLVAATLCHSALQAATIEVVNRLADHLGCERVSLGFRRGLPIRLQALSHLARFDARSQLVRGLESLMEEAVDQHTSLIYPDVSKEGMHIYRAHSEWVKQRGKAAICTVPLMGKDNYIGAITYERDADKPFDKETQVFCETVARLIGPILEFKLQEERSILAMGIAGLRSKFSKIFGVGHQKLKLITLFLIVLIGGLSVAEGEYRVTAPATLQGAIRHVLVAPQDGYVKQGFVRAGEQVKQGDLLATLDDRTLQLELQKWQSEKTKLEKEYHQSLAKRDRSQLIILQAQIDQVEAEMRLVDDKIARTELRASFDGVVISGDLSQSQGAPVTLGQILFEVAPLDNYRVIAEVDEHDVAGLASGQTGKLIMAALPQTQFAFRVDSVISVALSRGDSNYFRVEGVLDDASEKLRPGMHGVVKIDRGQRKLLWIWTHSVIDRLRLMAWSLGLIQ